MVLLFETRILDDMGEGLESQISIFGLLSGEEVLTLHV